MRQAERLSAILERISTQGGVGVAELGAEFGASPATIRRDLEVLEGQRLLVRTHGGAAPIGVAYELPLRYKSARHQEEKRRIAQAAAALVADGMAVGLTGGTTCTEVARALVERDITIVTNALNIASELAVRPNLKLVVTGGYIRQESYELVGPLAEASLASMNLDVVFIGTDGIDAAAGLTTHHEVEAHTDLALMERARRVVVVADSSKLGAVAFARICPVERIHELITDADAGRAQVAALREAGVAVTAV